MYSPRLQLLYVDYVGTMYSPTLQLYVDYVGIMSSPTYCRDSVDRTCPIRVFVPQPSHIAMFLKGHARIGRLDSGRLLFRRLEVSVRRGSVPQLFKSPKATKGDLLEGPGMHL